MYAEVAWVLASSGTQVQLLIMLDPDYFPDHLSVSYDYDTPLTAEKIFGQFYEAKEEILFELHYNMVNSYTCVNVVKIYKWKAKDSEISADLLCLCNCSKRFLVDNIEKTGLYGYFYDFSVDYDSIDVDNVLDAHKYLIKKHDIK